MTMISRNEQDTFNAGIRIGQKLNKGNAVLFTGTLGSGKTYFTKGIGKALLIKDEVVSPTFSMVNEYYSQKLECPVFHFDLFRLDDYDSLYGIGFFDYIEKGGVVIIEWSENIPEVEREFNRIIKINITKTTENEREIDIDDSSGN